MTPTPRLRLVGLIVACTAALLWWLLRDDRPRGDARTSAGAEAGDDDSPSGGHSFWGGGLSNATAPAEKLFSLEGKVVYLDGRPAEGATVRILSRPSAGRVAMAPDRQATSDAEGG